MYFEVKLQRGSPEYLKEDQLEPLRRQVLFIEVALSPIHFPLRLQLERAQGDLVHLRRALQAREVWSIFSIHASVFFDLNMAAFETKALALPARERGAQEAT